MICRENHLKGASGVAISEEDVNIAISKAQYCIKKVSIDAYVTAKTVKTRHRTQIDKWMTFALHLFLCTLPMSLLTLHIQFTLFPCSSLPPDDSFASVLRSQSLSFALQKHSDHTSIHLQLYLSLSLSLSRLSFPLTELHTQVRSARHSRRQAH